MSKIDRALSVGIKRRNGKPTIYLEASRPALRSDANSHIVGALSHADLALSRPLWASFEMPNGQWELLTAICETKNLSPQEFVRLAQINNPGRPPEDATCLEIHEHLRAGASLAPAAPQPVTYTLNECASE